MTYPYRPSRRYGGYNNRSAGASGAWIVGILAFVAVVVVALLILLISSYSKTSPVTFKITSKEAVPTDSGHEYRVYTNQGTFKVGDSIVHPRFNSADVYGRLKPGHSYTCKSWGWRIPVFSSFKNLTDCRETH